MHYHSVEESNVTEKAGIREEQGCRLCPRNCGVNREAGEGSPGGSALLGGALHFGKSRLGYSVFLRLSSALRVLPE